VKSQLDRQAFPAATFNIIFDPAANPAWLKASVVWGFRTEGATWLRRLKCSWLRHIVN